MRVFLTGATGFVGRAFLRRAAGAGVDRVDCLVRDPARLPAVPGVRAIHGDLARLSPAALEALETADVVIHLAASTGRATEAEHFRINAEGTRRLVEACRAAGVRRFVHVSTIAVDYPEIRHYPYARSKREAEAAVRASGLDFAIVRPTIVFGPGSPVGASLAGLAAAPVLPLFGGGRAAMHPVHVDDVADALLALAARDELGGRTWGLGGREAVPFGDFLRSLRRELRGSEWPALPVPVRPAILVLAALERWVGPALPVQAGQLYAFAHDGVASPDDGGVLPPAPGRRGVAEIVHGIAADRSARVAGGEALGVPGQPRRSPAGEPPPADPAVLRREVSVLTRHLIGVEPPPYVAAKYVAAHEPGREGPGSGEGDVLVSLAHRGPFAARLADAWGALFDRGGPLRRKLVLIVALLESTGSTAARVDTPDRGGAVGFLVRAVLEGALFAGTVLFAAPFVLAERRRGRS
jgi:NADH dehydrogenase